MAIDEETELAGVLRKTCDIEYGIVNPQVAHDLHPMIVPGQDPSEILANMVENQSLIKERTDNRWGAIVQRVDYNLNGVVEVKARIIEKDGVICDPPEYVPPNVKSNSHFFINKERTYTWQGKCPAINEKIFVSIPPDGSYKTPGKILDLTGKYYGAAVKSSPLEDQSALPPAADVNFPPPPGSGVGSGESNPSDEIPPVETGD